ncbi:hypothetical protein BDM02DRAFT_3123509 [Thelephora ganbajun]|uniref:Uncharacterized protein n=1 Tax=Thelephora ganbajun TaxID=370292 RepID=A0ACB6Z1M5_THEGA|nr:hypothetical protein BDM02DRAFT_3123509 [Thelephora ganbajun]
MIAPRPVIDWEPSALLAPRKEFPSVSSWLWWGQISGWRSHTTNWVLLEAPPLIRLADSGYVRPWIRSRTETFLQGSTLGLNVWWSMLAFLVGGAGTRSC